MSEAMVPAGSPAPMVPPQPLVQLVTARINGDEVTVPQGTSILDAASKLHVRIPTLCKHPDLDATAACGICVVRVKGQSKMPRACCTPLEAGMDITTHDPEVVEMRKTVVELILSKHPNECFTCLRNTRCELQTLASDFGIQRADLPSLVPDLPCDISTGTIKLDPRKCIACGRCLQVCQEVQNVWALSFMERGIETRIAPAGDISLAESPCISCGQCSAHCPTGAIVEFDETDKVWDFIRDPNIYSVVQIAPAVRVAVGEMFGLPPGEVLTGKLYTALRMLGFEAVFDTNFGADLTIMEEATEFKHRYVDNKGELPLITSCCPSWVDFMEKFHSDMIPHFSTCKSPHAMVGVLSKSYYAQQKGIPVSKIRMISIMPCTSKKFEIHRSREMYSSGQQDVDVSITTRELARMIKQAGLDFANLPVSPADKLLGEYSGAGTIFGASGGVAEAALRTAFHFITGEELTNVDFHEVRGLDGVKEAEIDVKGAKLRVAVAHGLSNVEIVLDRIRKARDEGGEPAYHLVEVMACPGGCIGGGGQPYGITDRFRERRGLGLYQDDKKAAHRCSHQNLEVKALYDSFLEKPGSDKAHKLLHTSYTPRPAYQR